MSKENAKKVLIVSQFFYPENFKCNDIAFDLSQKGYKVTVLTGIPNYPEGEFYKGYSIFRKRKEIVNQVNIYRAFLFPRGKGGSLMLCLNYLSFAFFGSILAIYLSFTKKFDYIIVHQTSPVFQAIPAIWVKKIKKIPLFTWVLDVWPEALISGSEGKIKNKYIIGSVRKIAIWVYNNSKKILISSKGFEESILEKGDYKNKLIYFPNWCADILNIEGNYPIPELPKGFIIMYAGTIGKSQNTESVIKAAIELRNITDLKWVFIGDGSRRRTLEALVNQHNLQESVFIYGKFPFEAMPAFYKRANAMLLTLKGEYPDLLQVVPARLQSYMSASKPVLGMIEGGSAELIQETKCGYCVNADDYESFVSLIKDKVLTNKSDFEKLGMNGRKYFEKNFQQENCISNLCKIIEM